VKVVNLIYLQVLGDDALREKDYAKAIDLYRQAKTFANPRQKKDLDKRITAAGREQREDEKTPTVPLDELSKFF